MSRAALFQAVELKRVGTAATMLVVCGTIVIVAMTMMLGHYNSLAHSGPKAVLDGAVIALLVGMRGRWRCLALLATVYGLVLLMQVGLFYLLPVMLLAGLLAAGAGWAVDLFGRTPALVVAAIVYELVAGCGAPIKIYFGTGGQSEPFLWGLWLAEFPFRIAGATVGVCLARRWQNGPSRSAGTFPSIPRTGAIRSHQPRNTTIWPALVRVLMCILAGTVPLAIESGNLLGLIAAAFIVYAFAAGARRQIVPALLGLLWAWLVFGACSYAWHRDLDRIMDMWRTLVLRFAPMTLASVVLIATLRPLDLFRLLKRLRFGPAVLIPLSSVLRSIPRTRLLVKHSISQLRSQGHWTGPVSLFRRPIVIFRALLGPHLARWSGELSEDSPAMGSSRRPL